MNGLPDEPAPRRRRHRWCSVPSGWTLLVCLGLPAVKFCNGALPAAVIPPAWPMFLLGPVIALAATASMHRETIRSYAGVLCWYVRLVVLACSGWLVVESVAAGRFELETILALAVGGLLWVVTLERERSEITAARVATFSSATVAVLLGLVVTDHDILWGIQLAFGAACVMTIGSVWWWIEAYADSR